MVAQHVLYPGKFPGSPSGLLADGRRCELSGIANPLDADSEAVKRFGVGRLAPLLYLAAQIL
jgi:hypothetical protein